MGKLRPREEIVLGHVHCAAGSSQWTVISDSQAVLSISSPACPQTSFLRLWVATAHASHQDSPSGAQPPAPYQLSNSNPSSMPASSKEAFPAKDLTWYAFISYAHSPQIQWYVVLFPVLLYYQIYEHTCGLLNFFNLTYNSFIIFYFREVP